MVWTKAAPHELSLQEKEKGASFPGVPFMGTQQMEDKHRLEGIIARFGPSNNNSLAETLKQSKETRLMDLLSRWKGEIRKCILERAEGTMAFLGDK